MIDYLRNILSGIVSKPDEIHVEEQHDTLGILLTVSVARVDMPCIIGKEGKTLDALARIMRSYGFKKKVRVSLKIKEPR